jgi:hypothetical protein
MSWTTPGTYVVPGLGCPGTSWAIVYKNDTHPAFLRRKTLPPLLNASELQLP